MGENNSHEQAKELFDRIADDYASRAGAEVYNTSSLSFARRREIVESLLAKLGPGRMVLDYGMGPAVFATAVVRQGSSYIGIDISPKMIEKARELKLDNCTFVQGDLESLAQYCGSVDCVLLIGLIDYLHDPAEGLRKLAACVRPGGSIILSFRNRFSLPFIMRESAKRMWRAIRRSERDETTAFAAPVLENAFRPCRDLVPVLREAGFEQFQIRYLDCSPLFFNVSLPAWLWRVGRVMDRLLAGRATAWFCASGVLVARKRLEARS